MILFGILFDLSPKRTVIRRQTLPHTHPRYGGEMYDQRNGREKPALSTVRRDDASRKGRGAAHRGTDRPIRLL